MASTNALNKVEVYHRESLIFLEVVYFHFQHRKKKSDMQSQGKIKLNKDAKILFYSHIYLRHTQMRILEFF